MPPIGNHVVPYPCSPVALLCQSGSTKTLHYGSRIIPISLISCDSVACTSILLYPDSTIPYIPVAPNFLYSSILGFR